MAALETIVETLVVDQLVQEDDPKAIADIITKSALKTEEKLRGQFGENPLAMKVTETIVSLMDRAVKRVLEKKD